MFNSLRKRLGRNMLKLLARTYSLADQVKVGVRVAEAAEVVEEAPDMEVEVWMVVEEVPECAMVSRRVTVLAEIPADTLTLWLTLVLALTMRLRAPGSPV